MWFVGLFGIVGFVLREIFGCFVADSCACSLTCDRFVVVIMRVLVFDWRCVGVCVYSLVVVCG